MHLCITYHLISDNMLTDKLSILIIAKSEKLNKYDKNLSCMNRFYILKILFS